MAKYIQFGKYNKNYKYIIMGTLFSILTDYFVNKDILDNENKHLNLSVHTNIIAIYIHIFILILSSILNKISFENKSITDSEEKKSGKIIINIIFISFMWVLIEFIQDLLFNLNILYSSLIKYLFYNVNI